MIVYALKVLDNDFSGETVGLFSEQDIAIKKIERNTFDLYECGAYPYAVVFPIKLDMVYYFGEFPNSEEKWFKWNKEEKGYKAIERPSFMENEEMVL